MDDELQELDDPTELILLAEPPPLGVAGLCCDCDAKYGTPTDAPNSVAMISGREAILCSPSPHFFVAAMRSSVEAWNDSSSFSASGPLGLRQPKQMNSCSELADIHWLTGNEARTLLAELADNTAPLHSTIAKLRRQHSATRTHLLVEQAELRRRATAKFTHPEEMFFTRVGLEQSTDEWIAAYKATRFAPLRAGSSPTPAIYDLCCGIGGDLIPLAAQSQAIGFDRDPISAHFAHLNARTEIRPDDVTTIDLTDYDAWHIDPDRRPTGKRTTSLDHCAPDRAAIEQMLARNPCAAIKLAPATKLPPDWQERCELEWISRDGECKQLVAWHGTLAEHPNTHRATILFSTQASRGVLAPGSLPRTIIGAPNQLIPIASEPHRYIFDVDPAILAAHLTGALAAEHNLSALSSGPTYLTGPTPITDDALDCFEVREILPFRTLDLSQALRQCNIGQLEIKKRGLDVTPETLRRDLKLRGNNAATLLLCRIANRPTAILADRISYPSSS